MALTTFVAGNVLTAAQLNDSFAAVGGLRATVPTSATVTGAGSSATVGTNGTVTFSSAESLSVNGVFSSAFRNYMIVCDLDSSVSSANVDMRLRVAGSDNSTANSYVRQQISGDNTTVGGTRVTTTSWVAASVGSAQTNGFSMYLYRPFLADQTAYSAFSMDAFSNAYMRLNVGSHNQATSYDGFTFIASSGNVTGTVTVYGLFG